MSIGFAACGGGDDDDDDSGNGASASETEGTGGEDSGNSDDGDRAAFTEEELEQFATTAVPGYTAQGTPQVTRGVSTIVYEPEAEDAQHRVIAMLRSGCDVFVCWDLQQEVTPEHEENLKSTLSRRHIDNPDLIFEFGTLELQPGSTGFFYYARSFIQEGTSTLTANSYTLFYHDDVNHLTLQVTPDFSISVDSAEELESLLDQEQAEEVVRTFFAAFEGEFGTND